jgi:hypothetical protein
MGRRLTCENRTRMTSVKLKRKVDGVWCRLKGEASGMKEGRRASMTKACCISEFSTRVFDQSLNVRKLV